MRVGIVGLPGSGKTSLFVALTRGTVKVEMFGAQSAKPNIGVVCVPDKRIDYFVEQYSPKKTTYASIEFIDGAAKIAQEGTSTKFAPDFFQDVRQVDALVHVVRGFTNDIGEEANPVKDVQTLKDEILLADLQFIDTRMQRVEKQTHGVKKGTTTPATQEMDFLKKLQELLENGGSIASLEFNADEDKLIRSYGFLTLKPMIVVLNASENEITSPTTITSEFKSYCEANSIPECVLCAQLEMEVSQMSDEDEAEFLASMGINEPARSKLINMAYDILGLISFITAGEPEVRAWTIRKGTKAVDAAGAIHSDIARGFIRAEVGGFEEVKNAGGWEEAKKKGILQLHGKEYIMQDGDTVYIRFKV